jgi:hypothetical protein
MVLLNVLLNVSEQRQLQPESTQFMITVDGSIAFVI